MEWWRSLKINKQNINNNVNNDIMLLWFLCCVGSYPLPEYYMYLNLEGFYKKQKKSKEFYSIN